MAGRKFLKLTIPNDIAYLPIAQKCVRKLLPDFGSSEKGVTIIIRYAFGYSIKNTRLDTCAA